jgi:hypothetical protein
MAFQEDIFAKATLPVAIACKVIIVAKRLRLRINFVIVTR